MLSGAFFEITAKIPAIALWHDIPKLFVCDSAFLHSSSNNYSIVHFSPEECGGDDATAWNHTWLVEPRRAMLHFQTSCDTLNKGVKGMGMRLQE